VCAEGVCNCALKHTCACVWRTCCCPPPYEPRRRLCKLVHPCAAPTHTHTHTHTHIHIHNTHKPQTKDNMNTHTHTQIQTRTTMCSHMHTHTRNVRMFRQLHTNTLACTCETLPPTHSKMCVLTHQARTHTHHTTHAPAPSC
jgi:hypothetical protein